MRILRRCEGKMRKNAQKCALFFFETIIWYGENAHYFRK
jgi:hypothetical protein